MITDKQARQIACDWHGGGGSPLYALCSTGAIDTARADHDVAAEIAGCFGIGTTPKLRQELVSLLEYVTAHGRRGPVDGWSRMP